MTITANPDVYSVPVNAALVTNVTNGVLANDTTDGTAPFVPVLATSPREGSLALNNDGSFTYTPSSTATGTDSFTYYDDDGTTQSNTTTVTLHINAVDLFPTANPDAYNFLLDTPLVVAAAGVLGNDQSPQSLPLTAKIVAGAQHGQLALATDGSFTYTPTMGSTLGDSFTYEAVDSNGLVSLPTTVTLAYNGRPVSAPTAVNDAYSVAQEKTLAVSAPGVLINDTGAGDGTLAAVVQTLPAHGSLELNSDGSFVYSPDTGFHGTDSFTYLATNGKLTGATPATVTITVSQVFHAPVAVDDSYSIAQGATLTVAAAGVLANDTEVDSPSSPLTAALINQAQHGTVTLNADGSFSYMPTGRYSGSDSFTYKASANGLASNIATVALTITPVATAPVALPISFTTNENQALASGAPGVLLNSGDPDGRPLSANLVANVQHGTLTLLADGSFTYTPVANYSGTDTFSFDVSDGVLTSGPVSATITINPVPQVPSSQNASYATDEDSTLTVPSPGLLALAGSPNGVPLTTQLVTSTGSGSLQLGTDGSFTYTPNFGFSGTDTFTYRVVAGTLSSTLATVSITVAPIPATVAAATPATVTGVSGSTFLSDSKMPVFSGTTVPGLLVLLQGRLAGSATAPVTIGAAYADSTGHFTVQSGPLGDSSYDFFVEALRPTGQSTGQSYAGTLTIATAAPKLVAAYLIPGTGQVELELQGTGVGLNTTTLANLANYEFFSKSGSTIRNLPLTGARILPDANPLDPVAVILQTRQKSLARGTYLIQAFSSGITDLAGNRLDGAFTKSFPSGDGQPGSNFKAAFVNKGRTPIVATPTSAYIPTVVAAAAPTTTSGVATAKAAATKVTVKATATPVVARATIAGPHALLKRAKAARH